MFLFQKLLNWIRSWFRREPLYRLEVDAEVIEQLQQVALKEQRPTSDVAKEMISHSLVQYVYKDENLKVWKRLTAREQQVAALICLGLSNRQIASQLHLSEATVKIYASNAYYKFGVRNRSELRGKLAGWDFSDWLQEQ